MKLLKESTGNYFHDFEVGRGFSELKEHNLLKKKLINWTASKKTSADQNTVRKKQTTNREKILSIH